MCDILLEYGAAKILNTAVGTAQILLVHPLSQWIKSDVRISNHRIVNNFNHKLDSFKAADRASSGYIRQVMGIGLLQRRILDRVKKGFQACPKIQPRGLELQ